MGQANFASPIEIIFDACYEIPMITPAQLRAARALLDWSQQRLAEAANIGNATIRNFEAGRSAPQSATLTVLQQALETAGVIFVDENGEGPGVRLRKGT